MEKAPYYDSMENIPVIEVHIHFYNKAKYISPLLLGCHKHFGFIFTVEENNTKT